jgi:peptidoglycan/xylan/chitin deacetylase (PgdA/CDA1 family)
MKNVVAGLIAASLFSFSIPTSAAPPIKLTMNGEEIHAVVPPQIVEGRAMIPIRAAAEALGAKVDWDQSQKAVIVNIGQEGAGHYHGGSSLKLIIHGQEVKTGVPLQMVNGSVLVPIRVLAEELGCGVQWDASQRAIWITNQIVNPTDKDLKGQAMITFSYDDGLDTFYDFALPLHEKYGIPATENVIAGKIKNGANTMYLEADQIKDIYDRGVEIGSHSYSHTDGLTTLSDEDLDFELRESKAVLEKIVPKVQTIGIPFSMYDKRVETAVKKYYQAARNFEHLQNSIPPPDPLWMHTAVAVTNTMTFDQIKQRIDEAVQKKTWCIIMLHGVDPDNRDTYEIKPALLEQLLSYVNGLGRDRILPVKMIDGVTLTKKLRNEK